MLQALQLKRCCCWAKSVACICDIWLFVCRLYNYGMGVHLLQVEEDIELAIQNRNREINPRDDHISFQVLPASHRSRLSCIWATKFVACWSPVARNSILEVQANFVMDDYCIWNEVCAVGSNPTDCMSFFFWDPTLTFLATTRQHDIRHCVLLLWSHRYLENRRETWKNACLWGYQIPVLSTEVLGVP